jgi:tRNA(Ile)-lysidine synthase
MKGRKKLQDLLVDAKVPRFQRRFVPVVAAGEEIVWVVGHQIADQFKVRPATKDILRLAAEA